MADTRTTQLVQFGVVTSYPLTTSYVGSNAIRCGKSYQVGLDISYVQGAAETGNSVQLAIDFSNVESLPTSTDWFQAASLATTTGVSTISLQSYDFVAVSAAGTADKFHISFPTDAKWFRIRAKETGVAANAGTLVIRASVSESNT